jgi:hypothetical protein
VQCKLYQPAAYFKWSHTPTAARAVVAAVAALDAAAAAAVARMAPLLNCGSAVVAAPIVGASCSTTANATRACSSGDVLLQRQQMPWAL